jgi:DNA-binding IclR family transcriptional regulator
MAATSDLNQKASGLLQELSRSFGLSARLGIWDSDAVVIIFAGFPLKIPQHPSCQVGPRVVGFGSAIGRAILANMERNEVINYLNRSKRVNFTAKTKIKKTEILNALSDVRKKGYAICDEEIVYGSAAIGVLVFDRHGSVTEAMTVVGSRDQILGSKMESLVAGLSLKAMQVSQSIGFSL